MSFSEQLEEGKKLADQSKYSEAIERLEPLLESLGFNHRLERIQCLNILGYCLVRIGKLAAAKEHSEKALRLAEQPPPDLQGQGDALNRLGGIYRDLGDPDRAIEYYKKSLTLREQIGDQSDIIFTLQNIAGVYAWNGDLTQAEKLYQEAAELYETQINPVGNPLILWNLGVVYWFRGDLVRAEVYGKRVFTIAEQINHPFHLAGSFGLLGAISWYRGDLNRAKDYLERALILAEQLNEHFSICNFTWILTKVLFDLKAYDEAINYIEKLERLAQDTDMPLVSVIHQGLKAELKLNQHDLTSALDLAIEYKAQTKKFQFGPHKIQALQIQLQVLLQLYSLTQQAEYKSQSGQLLQEMTQLSQQERLFKTQVELHMMKGLLHRGEANFQKALNQFEQAQKLAEAKSFHDQAEKAQELIAQLQKQMVMLQQLRELSPQAYEQAQLADMINYMQKAQKHIQKEQFKPRL